VLPYLERFLLVLIILFGLMSIFFLTEWFSAKSINTAYKNGQLIKHNVGVDGHQALMVAHLFSQQDKTDENIKRTMQALSVAESSQDTLIRSHAKFSTANLYFDLSAISGDIAAGGSHQQTVAQIELAREAYKSALRLNPDFYEARFNLELLDRLSPEKRTQGWQAETDGVTLQPFKRNGTAMMRDNTRRGLP
jgi:tetratricopeptide (TPR) repeat protein